VFLSLLVNFTSCYLVPNPQDVGTLLAETFGILVLTPFSVYSRHLFTLKSIVAPVAGISFFIWCIVKANGVGPIISRPSTVHGSELGWDMVVSLMSCISNMATLVT